MRELFTAGGSFTYLFRKWETKWLLLRPSLPSESEVRSGIPSGRQALAMALLKLRICTQRLEVDTARSCTGFRQQFAPERGISIGALAKTSITALAASLPKT
jgi:hypothetical protein